MTTVDDMVVTLRLKDEFTPALKRVRRQVWWYQYGESVMRAVTVLLVIAAFILGRLT